MKKILVYVIFACFAFTATAQDYAQHQFLFRGTGGMNTLLYNITGKGSVKAGFGGGAGLGYNFFLSQHLAIGTGVEFSLYNTSVTYDNLQSNYLATDMDKQENFTFQYTLKNFEEKQSLSFITVPILFTWQNNKFYASGGFRIAIPLSSSFDQTSTQLQTNGTYPDGNSYGPPAGLPIPEAGFVNKNNYTASGNLELKTSFMLSLEGGMKWELSDKWSLYTGLYADYGLNDMKDVSGKNPVQYQQNKPSVLLGNSVLNSSYVNNIHTLSLGLRISIAFGKITK